MYRILNKVDEDLVVFWENVLDEIFKEHEKLFKIQIIKNIGGGVLFSLGLVKV